MTGAVAMTIEQEIVEWAATRPSWQRLALKRTAQGQSLGADELAELAPKIVGDTAIEDALLALDDIPGGSTSDVPVALLSIGHPQNINALVDTPGLTFAGQGITVVYGDNGSGKSGYARLVKSVVRARHQEPVLTDVFSDTGRGPQAAEITVQVAGVSRPVAWPDTECPELTQIGFYDEACGDAYVSKESDVRYRPSSLFLLDHLIRACDAIRGELDKSIEANKKSAKALPVLSEGTGAAQFVSSLSQETTSAEVEVACKISSNVDAEIDRLTREEARLRATAPAEEKRRLMGHSRKFERVATHLSAIEAILGKEATERLGKLHGDLRGKRAAAELAARKPTEHEPLSAIGSAAWKTLWEAARAFAKTEAYPGQLFPFTGVDARCFLCQQELSSEASVRLRRFEEFVTAKIQRELEQATSIWSKDTTALRAFVLRPSDIESILDDLEAQHAGSVKMSRDFIEAAEVRLKDLLECCDKVEWNAPTGSLPSSPAAALNDLSKKLATDADAIDDASFEKEIARTHSDRLELEARKKLSACRDDILGEVDRLCALAKLNTARAQTNTTGISMKSTELARKYVTRLVRDRFTRESDRLLLERVTLDDLGSPKGKLHHKPAFVGAVQQVAMPRVLSEGEQTALGLAGFFTEVFLDASRSAVVLDDPVSSLDHVRRGHVASRLVEFAATRQVIVFTHDITFVNELRLAAERENVTFAGRGIERRLSGEPGVCGDTHPWKVKDVKQRLGELQDTLARFKKDKSTWDQQAYERETSDWAGKLSETWERMLSQEIVGQVVDRGTLEVRPKSFRILAKITDDDDREFQASYARCSRWARRHDKSGEVNYVPPTLKELEDELALVRTWFDRIKKYRD